ncbi:MAG: hypothetical protein PVF91_08505 [Chromatiales bacterium]
MRLNTLQAWLERIYDLRVDARVEDFLFSGREVLEQLVGDPDVSRDTPEMLLVSEQDDGVDLSLFLDRDLLDRLAADSPALHLHDDNLAPLLVAVEGVSHFLYLVWHVGLSRPVTQLELEIQAEVDKFIVARLLARRHYGPGALGALREGLFRRFRVRQGLPPERRARYLRASSLADHYCRTLDDLSGRRGCPPPVRSELRRFYRMGQSGKIRHIRAAGGA